MDKPKGLRASCKPMILQSHVTKAFGFVLVLVGIIGFFPNPLVGHPDEALFGVNTLHNIVHLATGLIALGVAYLSDTPEHHSRTYNMTFGVIYLIVALAGFLLKDTMETLLAVNVGDNVLHVLFTVVLLGAAFMIDVPGREAR